MLWLNYLGVATVLTVYGIETTKLTDRHQRVQVATVLTVYGIETSLKSIAILNICSVATVLTVYGIETYDSR